MIKNNLNINLNFHKERRNEIYRSMIYEITKFQNNSRRLFTRTYLERRIKTVFQ